MCNKCYRAMTHIEETGGEYKSGIKVRLWERHTSTDCSTCTWYAKRSQGGRPKKRGRSARSSTTCTVKCAELIRRVTAFDMSSLKGERALNISRFTPPALPVKLESFLCSQCSHIVDKPVETTCEHIMCQACLLKTLHKTDTPICPTCSKRFGTKSEVNAASPLLRSLLATLVVTCDNEGCSASVPLSELRGHLLRCTHTQAVISPLPSSLPTPSQPTAPLTPSKISLRSVLSTPLDQPPSDVEKRAATHLVRRIMQTQEAQGGEHLKLPTGGQVSIN